MQKAIVRWFCNLSQEGMIRVGEESIYVNNDPCHGFRLMNGKRLTLNSGDSVMVEVFEDYNWKQISKLEVI